MIIGRSCLGKRKVFQVLIALVGGFLTLTACTPAVVVGASVAAGVVISQADPSDRLSECLWSTSQELGGPLGRSIQGDCNLKVKKSALVVLLPDMAIDDTSLLALGISVEELRTVREMERYSGRPGMVIIDERKKRHPSYSALTFTVVPNVLVCRPQDGYVRYVIDSSAGHPTVVSLGCE